MNLLKLLIVSFCAASFALIFSTTAKAVDHPWDDNVVDSSRSAGNYVNVGEDPKPPDKPVIQKITTWMQGFFREVKGIFLGGTSDRVEVKPRETSTQRVESPLSHRKHK